MWYNMNQVNIYQTRSRCHLKNELGQETKDSITKINTVCSNVVLP